MSNLKKPILALAAVAMVVIIGSLFLLPYALGFFAQAKYSQLLNALPKTAPMQIALLDYQRGWFSSEATLKITLQTFSPQATTSHPLPVLAPLLVKQHIEHGPVFSLPIAKGEKKVVLGQTLITSHMQSTYAVADMVSWVKLNGAVWGIVKIPTLQLANQQRTQSLVANNVTGLFKLSRNLEQFTANLSVPVMSIKVGTLQQDINQAQLYYQLQKSDSGLFLGKRTLTIDSMVWNTPLYTTPLKFVEIMAQSYDQEKNHKISDEIQLRLGQFVFHNASYGPQRFDLAINQLDASSLLALKKELNYLRNSADFSQPELRKYQQLFTKLLNNGLNVQLKQLVLVTPWGSPSLMANFTLPAQAEAEDNLFRLVANADLKVEVDTPATFLLQALSKFYTITQGDQTLATHGDTMSHMDEIAQQKIASWVDKKWLLPKDNGYHMSLLYQHQQVIVNGQPLTATNLSNNTICKNAQRLS